MRRDTAQLVAAGLLCVVGAFQAALAAGAPWGSAAYGGTHVGVLPRRLRRVSGATVPVYIGAAALVAADPMPPRAARPLLGGLACVFAVGAVLNGVSRSPVERAVWTPTSAMLAVTLWRSRPTQSSTHSRATSADHAR